MKEFSEDEKAIARNIDKKYKWIARNKSGSLVICTRKPIKCEKSWCVDRIDEFNQITEHEHIFKSIVWEDDEPTLIKDIYDPQIISDEEREYLKFILKPFRNEIGYIEKSIDYIEDYSISGGCCTKEYLFIRLRGGSFIFPSFNPGEMYSGMEPNKRYSTEELGITYTEEK